VISPVTTALRHARAWLAAGQDPGEWVSETWRLYRAWLTPAELRVVMMVAQSRHRCAGPFGESRPGAKEAHDDEQAPIVGRDFPPRKGQR